MTEGPWAKPPQKALGLGGRKPPEGKSREKHSSIFGTSQMSVCLEARKQPRSHPKIMKQKAERSTSLTSVKSCSDALDELLDLDWGRMVGGNLNHLC